jgi:hypothetical protein
MFAQFISNARIVAGCVLSLAFIAWAYRRKYELDDRSTSKSHVLRWLAVVFGFVIACLPNHFQGSSHTIVATVQISALLICVAFACWPNFATRIFPNKTEAGVE